MKNHTITVLLIKIISLGFLTEIKAQEKLTLKQKRFGFTNENVVYTNEKVIAFPRGFIYDVNHPESAFYLGCFGSDVKMTKDYFNGKSDGFSFSVNDTILRDLHGYFDTIFVESLDEKLERFSKCSNKEVSISDSTEYVIMYYWTESLLDNIMKPNFKFFQKYMKQHPEKHIQFFAVGVEIEEQ